jgi:hypothetical protein
MDSIALVLRMLKRVLDTRFGINRDLEEALKILKELEEKEKASLVLPSDDQIEVFESKNNW